MAKFDINMFASDISQERKTEIIHKIAQKVVELRLTTIAIVMLESSKPISFLGSQLMIFFQPIFTSIFPFTQYDEFAALLEDRKNVEILIQEIERLDEEKRQKGKKPGDRKE
ncbi:MAG: hypothetical protein OEZ20_07900 [candidate division WOR-3 bacterium]|nr:hypothetical protein [candidate division WOR-3 bacterium]